MSALDRINTLYETKGFRVVSGEGGRPFGLERYGKALYVAWHYKHRVALGDPTATIRGLAAKEGITGRFADHVWTVVNKPNTGYPTRETVNRWTTLPAPTSDIKASLAKGRAGCDEIQKYLTTWPSWFFARGDLAAGGAGDESPLAFDDETLKVEPTHRFTYGVGRSRRARPRRTLHAGSPEGHILFTDVAPGASATPVVIWRNPRVVIARGRRRGAARRVLPPLARWRRPRRPRRVDGGVPGPSSPRNPCDRSCRRTSRRRWPLARVPTVPSIGPDDFATAGTVSFTIDVPAGGNIVEFQADAELGKDRNAVVRVMLSAQPEGTARDALQRVLIGDPQSAGYKAFRANMAEYVSLLPPNSHGEANPADKDPVPAPFDNTYNSPEHDAFVLKVKYQRSDKFFTDNMVDGADRVAAESGVERPVRIVAVPRCLPGHARRSLRAQPQEPPDRRPGCRADCGAARRRQAVPHVAARALRRSDEGAGARAAWPHCRCADLRQPRLAPAAHGCGEGEPADVLSEVPHGQSSGSRRRDPRRARSHPGVAGFPLSGREGHERPFDPSRTSGSPRAGSRGDGLRPGPRKPLNGWEVASRMSFFLWSSIPDDELRRAAAAGELSNPALLAKQVKRMTADPKARRLATEFFGQWLGFYHFDQYRGVDTGRFPEFTDEVRSAMYDEAVSTFEYIVRQAAPGEGDPLRRLHVPQQAIGQVLRRREGC